MDEKKVETIETGRIIAGIVAVLTVGIAGFLVYQGFMMPAKSVVQQPVVPSPGGIPKVVPPEAAAVAPDFAVCDLLVTEGSGWSLDFTKGGSLDVVSGSRHALIACASEIPGIPLSPEKIEDVTLDGVVGKLYHDASPADGTPEDDVRVRVPLDDLDVSVRGTPGFVAEVVAALKWVK